MHGRELLAEGITGGLGGCRAENRMCVSSHLQCVGLLVG